MPLKFLQFIVRDIICECVTENDNFSHMENLFNSTFPSPFPSPPSIHTLNAQYNGTTLHARLTDKKVTHVREWEFSSMAFDESFNLHVGDVRKFISRMTKLIYWLCHKNLTHNGQWSQFSNNSKRNLSEESFSVWKLFSVDEDENVRC